MTPGKASGGMDARDRDRDRENPGAHTPKSAPVNRRKLTGGLAGGKGGAGGGGLYYPESGRMSMNACKCPLF